MAQGRGGVEGRRSCYPRRMAIRRVAPPRRTFTSPGRRRFEIGPGEREEGRWGPETTWPILYRGKPAGKLFQDSKYALTDDGQQRFHASTRQLFWTHATDAPTGVGFDVAAFDTLDGVLVAWGRSADQILDWAAGKPVHTGYEHAPVRREPKRSRRR